MKITKKIKSKTINYYVFPDGIRKETLDSALAIAKPGDWIREYTMICKDITVEKGNTVVGRPTGIYLTSKEIRDEKLSEPVKS